MLQNNCLQISVKNVLFVIGAQHAAPCGMRLSALVIFWLLLSQGSCIANSSDEQGFGNN